MYALKTPSMYATSRDQHIIRLLIERGADPELQNKSDSFPINYASTKSNPIKTLLRIQNNEKKNNNNI
jgi:ankyrin repeat protein